MVFCQSQLLRQFKNVCGAWKAIELSSLGEAHAFPGQQAGDFHSIRSGTVRGDMVSGCKKIAPQNMGPGTVFGELAFFDGGPRSATRWANDDVDLLHLPLAAFERLAAWHPRIARELLLEGNSLRRLATRGSSALTHCAWAKRGLSAAGSAAPPAAVPPCRGHGALRRR